MLSPVPDTTRQQTILKPFNMATDIIARGMITEYIAGTNINFTENRDGTVEISASDSISSEDSVAREAIGNHKSDTSNPHNVTPAQIGLGDVDNTSDLDKPISTAVQKAIDNKADKTVATISADGLMSAEDKSKLDAFEITTTGGKLHDKDIATTDLIPTTLPANGGNADYAADADKLDGLHANEFIKVNSYDGYDCNTLYDAGLYLCSGQATNTPNDLKYGSLFVMPYRKPYGNLGPDYCAQIFIPNGDADDKSLWYRTSLQNTWNEWKRSCDDGNADTVNSLHTGVGGYCSDIFSTTLSPSHLCWNKKYNVYGQSNDINAELYIDNAPEIDIAVWYEVETIGNEGRAYQIAHGCYIHQRKSFIRYMHDAVWSDWFEIYTSNSKPYVKGTGSVPAYSSICTINFGFTPSLVLFWGKDRSVTVAPQWSDTYFNTGISITEDSTSYAVGYIAFK